MPRCFSSFVVCRAPTPASAREHLEEAVIGRHVECVFKKERKQWRRRVAKLKPKMIFFFSVSLRPFFLLTPSRFSSATPSHSFSFSFWFPLSFSEPARPAREQREPPRGDIEILQFSASIVFQAARLR